MTPLDALYRMQRAWEATQPQLFWTNEVLWPDTGLGDGEAVAHSAAEHAADLPIAEPVANPLLAVGGGLDPPLEAGEKTKSVSGSGARVPLGTDTGITRSPASSRDRLDPGAEPCRDQRELTANRSYAAPQPLALSPERRLRVGAPINTTGPGATLEKRSARPSRRTV